MLVTRRRRPHADKRRPRPGGVTKALVPGVVRQRWTLWRRAAKCDCSRDRGVPLILGGQPPVARRGPVGQSTVAILQARSRGVCVRPVGNLEAVCQLQPGQPGHCVGHRAVPAIHIAIDQVEARPVRRIDLGLQRVVGGVVEMSQ